MHPIEEKNHIHQIYGFHFSKCYHINTFECKNYHKRVITLAKYKNAQFQGQKGENPQFFNYRTFQRLQSFEVSLQSHYLQTTVFCVNLTNKDGCKYYTKLSILCLTLELALIYTKFQIEDIFLKK